MLMEILNKIKIIDLALYCENCLILSDIHIGFEESLSRQGVLVPRLQFEEMASRLQKIFGLIGSDENFSKIIINGDLKHDFGTISEQEWRNVLKFIDLCAKNCNELIIIQGNHDAVLNSISKKRNIHLVQHY